MLNRFRLLLACALPILALAGSSVASAADLSLSSPAIHAGAKIPKRFTCDGSGVSPTLMIQGVPRRARSLVIEILDPDAPGGTFVHWGLYNLAPDTSFLAAGAASHNLPGPAATITNGYHRHGYGAICPPHGQRHRYRFVLYALDTRLSQQPSSRADLAHAMKGHIVARTHFTARYERHD